jgi:coenzyme F420-dependent glucose-6-phosphate dehydrogenase
MKFAWLASHESYQPELLVEQAVLAESAGFDMMLASDHFHPWVDDTSAAGFAWSWLGAVAARPSEVELGTSVTCTARGRPVPVEVSAAQLRPAS